MGLFSYTGVRLTNISMEIKKPVDAIIQERSWDIDIEFNLEVTSSPSGGSIIGTDLWDALVYFTPISYGSSTELIVSPVNGGIWQIHRYEK